MVVALLDHLAYRLRGAGAEVRVTAIDRLDIELVPTFSAEVIKLAEPSLNVPVPSIVSPFINVTVSPFGGAPALEVNTALKVTACPYVDGVGEDERVVVVAGSTT